MAIDVEITSPEKRLLARSVDMVVMPGSEGDIAAMPGHAPIILLLRGGIVTLYEGDRAGDQFFVTGGFAEITPERCTILADEATPLAELSRARADERLRAAEQAYEAADKTDITTLEPYLDRIQSARVEVESAQG